MGNPGSDKVPQSVMADLVDLLAAMPTTLDPIDRLRPLFGEDLMGDGPEPANHGAEIASRVIDRVESGRPASFIRMGDGEGDLLALGFDSPSSLDLYCAARRSTRHFGSPEVMVDDGPHLVGALAAAVRGAELVGISPRATLAVMTHFLGCAKENRLVVRQPVHFPEDPSPDVVGGVHGVASLYRALGERADDLDLASTTLADATFHMDLLPELAWMLKDREFGLVTCFPELGPALCREFGATSVQVLDIPKQALLNEEPGNTGHYPQRYQEVVAELGSIEPGMLWLVSAGMLGKIYCDAIRRAGGVALDIGSVADIWAGELRRVLGKRTGLRQWALV